MIFLIEIVQCFSDAFFFRISVFFFFDFIALQLKTFFFSDIGGIKLQCKLLCSIMFLLQEGLSTD